MQISHDEGLSRHDSFAIVIAADELVVTRDPVGGEGF
jgi:hypothetical protein